MTEKLKYNNPIEEYRKYLKRSTRTNGMSLQDAHQLLVNRLIAEEYGVSKEQLV